MPGAEQHPPMDPGACRRAAEECLGEWVIRSQAEPVRGPLHALTYAVLAVAGELAAIRREMHKRR